MRACRRRFCAPLFLPMLRDLTEVADDPESNLPVCLCLLLELSLLRLRRVTTRRCLWLGVFRLYRFAGQCLLSFPKRSVVFSV